MARLDVIRPHSEAGISVSSGGPRSLGENFCNRVLVSLALTSRPPPPPRPPLQTAPLALATMVIIFIWNQRAAAF
jgi:hypothetical protein